MGQAGVMFSHGASFELELAGVMDESVEDGVGEGGVAEQLMPLGQGELAGDEGGARGVSVFEEVAAVVGVERGESEVVEDEEVGFGEGGEELGVSAVAAGDGEVVQEPGDAQVQCGEAVAAGVVSESTGEPGLADTGGAGDEDVEAFAQPASGGEWSSGRGSSGESLGACSSRRCLRPAPERLNRGMDSMERTEGEPRERARCAAASSRGWE